MPRIQMAKYNFKSAINKIDRLITSGRAGKYYDRAKRMFKDGSAFVNDIKNDYSNPAMGKKRRHRKRSTPKMGRRRRRR